MFSKLYSLLLTIESTIVLFLILGVIVVLLVAYIMGFVRLFKKCGKEGWKAIVPGYNIYVFVSEICGCHWGFSAVAILGLVLDPKSNLVDTVFTLLVMIVYACAFYNLAIRSNRDVKMAAILGGLFHNVMQIIYGYKSDFYYNGEIEVDEYSLLAPYINK